MRTAHDGSPAGHVRRTLRIAEGKAHRVAAALAAVLRAAGAGDEVTGAEVVSLAERAGRGRR